MLLFCLKVSTRISLFIKTWEEIIKSSDTMVPLNSGETISLREQLPSTGAHSNQAKMLLPQQLMRITQLWVPNGIFIIVIKLLVVRPTINMIIEKVLTYQNVLN
jgi:hypothetical protein